MTILFRAMQADGERPRVGDSARALGVRVDGANPDVIPDTDGNVHPGSGMSVSPDDPLNLPSHRRPQEFLGTGKDPIWQMEHHGLQTTLAYRPTSITHGQVEPDQAMSLNDYRLELAETQDSWECTHP